jgi:superfamily II DNA helicase RecQ
MSHNARTQGNHYFSKDLTEEDATNLSWWLRFGMKTQPSVDEDAAATRELSDFELLSALRSLLNNPVASWKSTEQLEACRLSANRRSQHILIALACGAGKSMTWNVPVLAQKMFTGLVGCTIVICPQTILLHQHVAKAEDMLQNHGIRVEGYTDGDLDSGIPDELLRCVREKGLLFLTLNALSTISHRHRHLLKTWAERKEIERVIIDEFHLLYDEFSIRAKEYLQLKHLVTLQAPVLVLSATLPPKIRASAEKFLGLDGSVCRISSDSYKAPDVAIKVTNTTQDDVVEDVCAKVEAKMQEDSDRAVHVVALFKTTGEAVASLLGRRGIVCEIVTSETPKSEKARIARAWCEGDLRVLVSTTGCGLDSPSCGCVIAAVGAWSPMSLVQYLGRIREPNQGMDASMDVLFVSDLGENTWEKFREDANLSAARMLENKLIDNVDDYFDSCSPMAVKEWAEATECRMVAALSKFGGSNAKCGRCDNCLAGNLFLRKSMERTAKMNRATQFMLEGREILAALKSNCLVCGNPNCDGKGVGDFSSYVNDRSKLCNKGCFKCGKTGDWDHKSSTCSVKAVTYAKNCHHCYQCLGPWADTGGLDKHGEGRCGLKSRLLGLYIWCYRNECSSNGTAETDYMYEEGFRKFMIGHFSNPEAWYEKLVTMCRKHGFRAEHRND